MLKPRDLMTASWEVRCIDALEGLRAEYAELSRRRIEADAPLLNGRSS